MLPVDRTVREGRDAYPAENGFSTPSYDEAMRVCWDARKAP